MEWACVAVVLILCVFSFLYDRMVYKHNERIAEIERRKELGEER